MSFRARPPPPSVRHPLAVRGATSAAAATGRRGTSGQHGNELEIGGGRVGSINAEAADAQLVTVLRERGYLSRGDPAGTTGGGTLRELCASPAVDIASASVVSLREIDRCCDVKVQRRRAAVTRGDGANVPRACAGYLRA